MPRPRALHSCFFFQAQSLYALTPHSGKVYDVTEFLPVCFFPPISLPNWYKVLIYVAQDHPGGSKIILKYAGRDATDAFEPIHPPDTLDKYLPKQKHLGDLDTSAAREIQAAREKREKTEDELRMEREQANKEVWRDYGRDS